MADGLTPDAQRRDDELAEFTDQLLDGDAPEALEMTAHDRDLLALQEVVVRLKRAFDAGQPNDIVAGRIWDVLVAEWHRAGLDAQGEPAQQRKFASRQPIWQSASRRRWMYAFVLVAVSVVVLALLVLLTTPIGNALPGAARGQAGLIPVIMLLGFSLGGVLWLLIRRK